MAKCIHEREHLQASDLQCHPEQRFGNMIVKTGILDEAILRGWSKNLSSIIPNALEHFEDGALRELDLRLESLLQTAEEPRLSFTHRAASCNALCGFLERGITSLDPELRNRCFNATVWNRTLTIYLERSGHTKPKPMKQVLMTLVKLLNQRPPFTQEIGRTFEEKASAIKANAVYKCLTFIYSDEELPCVKAAMHVLEVFLSKKITNLPTMIDMLRFPQEIVGIEDTPANSTTFSDADMSILELGKSSLQAFVSNIVNQILLWMKYPDIGPAAGHLLKAIFESLQDQGSRSVPTHVEVSSLPIWAEPIRQSMKNRPDLVEVIGHHVLPSLICLNMHDTTNFVNSLPFEDLQNVRLSLLKEEDIRLCLLVTQIIETFGLSKSLSMMVSEYRHDSVEYSLQSICLRLLVHASPNIRVVALSVLINSFSSTRPFTADLLYSLRQNMPFFHTEPDPKIRGEFITTAEKLCVRCDVAISRMCKKLNPSARCLYQVPMYDQLGASTDLSRHMEEEALSQHVAFFQWYFRFIASELRSTASYQRHITALKILQVMVRLKDFYDSQAEEDLHRLIRLLTDLVMDPFDDVRNIATTILKGIPPFILLTTKGSTAKNNEASLIEGKNDILWADQSNMALTLHRAENLMYQTGRADYADGLGRLYDIRYGCFIGDEEGSNVSVVGRTSILESLLLALENDIRISTENIRMAVSTTPLHGRLIALRYIVSQPDFSKSFAEDGENSQARWRKLQTRLLADCRNVWDVVKDILCLDSPEGHATVDSEDDSIEVKVKDTLSFAWRALKEASSLMYAMVTKPDYSSNSQDYSLVYEDLLNLGGLAFTQLAELRHRGAFSTVSQTFTACCVRCAGSSDPSVASLPKQWYQETLSCIQERASALTRRSAGLPAIITSILSAYPTGAFFDDVILDLQAISDAPVGHDVKLEEVRVPQVHALNCMKDIFTSTRLGPASEPHLAIALEIAVGCLENDVWAIRNCGLMLLKALLTRLNDGAGADSNRGNGSRRPFSRLIYEKYPILPDLVVGLLQKNISPQTQRDANQATTPPFIMSRSFQAVFPAMEIIERIGVPNSHRATVITLLNHQLGSEVWALREKAARTVSFLTDEHSVMKGIEDDSQSHCISQNALHGKLLCLNYIVRSHKPETGYFTSVLDLLVPQSERLMLSNPCPFTAATYLEILAVVLTALPRTNLVVSQHEKLLVKNFEDKWRQTFFPPDLKKSYRANPAQDLMVKALTSLFCYFRSKDSLSQYTMIGRHSRLVSDLIDRNESALSIILQCSDPVSGGNHLAVHLNISDYIFVFRHSSDPNNKALAMSHIASLVRRSPWLQKEVVQGRRLDWNIDY